MTRRAAFSWVILALVLCGPAPPAMVQAAPGRSGVLADIWVRLFPVPNGQVKAAIYVHTALQARCSAGIGGANGHGPGVTPQPGTIITGDDGIALFRYFFPKSAPVGRRWATASCTAGSRQVTVGSSFYLPYDAQANAVPPTAPLRVKVPAMTVAFGTPAVIVVHTLPRALCTGLMEGEAASGVVRTPLEPVLVDQHGTVTWTVRPTFTGIGSIAITCDLHKNFSRSEATITVQ
jgi:hypothetical protein